MNYALHSDQWWVKDTEETGKLRPGRDWVPHLSLDQMEALKMAFQVVGMVCWSEGGNRRGT